jgi:hypothetical protein
MTIKVRCKINGTDYGIDGENALVGLSIQPATDGAVGVFTVYLDASNTYTNNIRDKHRVHIYGFDTGSSSIIWWVGGVVSDRVTKGVKGTTRKLWEIKCQDHNLILDRVGRLLASGDYTVATDTFDHQAAAIVAEWQNTPSVAIDTSLLGDLVGSTNPGFQILRGSSLREALDRLNDWARVTNPAVRPRFYVDTSKAGDPVLMAYDAALPPTPTLHFSDAPTGGQKSILSYERDLDGTEKVEQRELFYGDADDYVSASGTDGVTARNVFAGDGYWWGAPDRDGSVGNSTDAQGKIDRSIERTKADREAVRIQVTDPVQAGGYVLLTWARDGLAGVTYRVVGVDISFDSAGMITYYDLTLGNRVLLFGQDGEDDIVSVPVEFDAVGPDAPTSFALAHAVYNDATKLFEETWSWVAPLAADLGGYQLEIVYGGVTHVYNPARAALGFTTTAPAGTTRTARLYGVDYSHNKGITATVSGTVGGAKNRELYNGGFAYPASPGGTLPAGWAVVLTGTATASVTTGGYDDNAALRLLAPSASTFVATSDFFAVSQNQVYAVQLACRSSSALAAAPATDIKAAYYDASDTLISTATLGSVTPPDNNWVLRAYEKLVPPAGTVSARIIIASTGTNPTGALVIDAVRVLPLALAGTAAGMLAGADQQKLDRINSGTFTMAGAASKTVTDANVTASSIIVLQATNAAAGTLQGSAKALYISAKTAGTSFAVTTASGVAAAGHRDVWLHHYRIGEP